MVATLRLREEQLKLARAVAGLSRDTDLAARMGVSRHTVHRTITQATGLSAGFVAALLAVFPTLTFDDLFEVTTSEDERAT
jgi:DNA-binding XRE family transcriptional regulator